MTDRLHLQRDEFSNDGVISPAGVRIIARNEDGRTFSTLSDNKGDYILDLPKGGGYTIFVNDGVFGENYKIFENHYLLEFNGLKDFNIDFIFQEAKREINFR